MATLHPARAAAEGRAAAHRVRLSRRTVYACRFCFESIKVTSARYLPEVCPGCRAGTWEDDGRCGAWDHCDAHRRDVDAAHCHACGYSVWTEVRASLV
jgi:hypothetical protein